MRLSSHFSIPAPAPQSHITAFQNISQPACFQAWRVFCYWRVACRLRCNAHAIMIGVIAVGVSGMLIAAAKRHVIELSQDLLVVKHSLYTLAVPRKEVASASIREVSSLDKIGLSTRKNGIVAFGYFSGWFWNTQGKLTFCAFSTLPVYLLTFEGSAKCRQLILGASPEMIRSIEAWSHA